MATAALEPVAAGQADGTSAMTVQEHGPVPEGMELSQQQLNELEQDEDDDTTGATLSKEQLRQLKLLLRTLCLICRDVPVPTVLLDSVARVREGWVLAEQNKTVEQRIKADHEELGADLLERKEAILLDGNSEHYVEEEEPSPVRGKLLYNFEAALERTKYASATELRRIEESRIQSRLNYRLRELQSLPSQETQAVSTIELNTLKLLALQRKIRFEIATELQLKQKCSRPESHLLDWGLVRLRLHFFSFLGGASVMSYTGSDEQIRKKRDSERQKRLEEQEQARIETRKRKFFNELLNLVREFQLQVQGASKLQKQRNDSILNWHAKQRQRATRAEKLRYQALKADDQEAYMRMVEESKNERLMTLLSKTDDLLQRLGAMVQMQKDAEPEDVFKRDRHRDRNKDGGKDASELSSPRSKNKENDSIASLKEKASKEGAPDSESSKKRDFLEGQRQYNSAVHQIEEQVTEQPQMLEGGQLRLYQLEGLQWMLSLYNNNLNGILADEMGLGKTIQTIGLFAYLIENKGLAGPHIIVAPKAVIPNWAHEFATWVPSLTIVVYDGRAEERRLLRELHCGEGQFNVLVTHYDLVMRDKQFLKKIRWHYMVVDEGHRLKNHDCMLARTLAQGYHIRRRLLLTGTPIQNSLQELWSLLNFILPAIFNSSTNFEEWFNAPFADRSEVQLTEEEQLLIIRRLHQVLRPFLLRRKKSEVEKYLPTKTQVILKCDLSAWQKLYYQQIIESGRVGLLTGTGKSKGLQNTAMQLRKCCNHPYLFLENDYEPREEDEIVRASGKFELLDRLLPKLRSTGHRCLLFSQMTRLMDILERYLAMRGFRYLRLDGTTKTEDRGRLLQLFNAENSPYFMFLLSTRAGGLGLNLQSADTVILFDSDWNPQMDQQAEDRAHRIGQKKEVHVYVLVSVGSIEEEILERAKSKMGIDAKVIQAGLFNTTSTAQERREMLEEIMRRGTSALSTDVPSEREINRLTASSEEEFEMFEELDEERRKDEGYRSRLMEEREVPEWVFLRVEEPTKAKYDFSAVEGKRKRKEVQYSDILSDSQWLKAVEDGQDVSEITKSELSKRTRLRESLTPQSISKRTTGATPSKGPIILKVRTRYGDSDAGKSQSPEEERESESEAPSSSAEDRPESSLDWRKLRRKRSKYQDSGDEGTPAYSDESYEKKFQESGRSSSSRKHARHS